MGDEDKDRSEAQTKSDVRDEQKNARNEDEIVKLPAEEEAPLLRESSHIKAQANELFGSGDFENAIARYHDAIEACPGYRFFELAVLHSNIAACHLKLEEWKDAIKTATDAIKALEKLDTQSSEDKEGGDLASSSTQSRQEDNAVNSSKAPDIPNQDDDDVEEEIISSGASKSAPAPTPPSPSASPSHPTPSDIQRIRTKALLRRARARSEANTWSDLSGAEEDYRALSALPPGSLTPADARTVRQQLRNVPPRTKAAQEQEMSEMWGKMRTLGDGLLKPFGLSTNNFQMVKDEKTGGYSMNFSQGDGGSGEGS